MEESIKDKLEKAVKWWRSLSYNEQDKLLVKYITYGEYYIKLAKAGHLTHGAILDMMEKEGVA